jgi:hypothetical protein
MRAMVGGQRQETGDERLSGEGDAQSRLPGSTMLACRRLRVRSGSCLAGRVSFAPSCRSSVCSMSEEVGTSKTSTNAGSTTQQTTPASGQEPLIMQIVARKDLLDVHIYSSWSNGKQLC